MRRGLLVVGGLLVVVSGVAWVAVPALARLREPIRVGLLHSLTGPMAISEKSMIDAEVLALEEINSEGGLLGRRVEWLIADGKSTPETFAREADRLIREEKVSVLIGCYTSASRKNVKPVVEKADHLLIYPVAYEGLELSPNIVYTGAAPNQQIIPTVKWCYDHLKAKSYFLIGSDYIWPRSVNTMIKDQLKALGATLLGEEYLEFGSIDVDDAVAKALAAKPDVILSTLVGDSNIPFYKKIRGVGSGAADIPIVSFIIAEDELRELPAAAMVNDYSVCNYFQSIDRAENQEFVRKFKARHGRDRVTSDTIATAYNSVKFWAQAVRDAETAEPREVRSSLASQSQNAPEGVISIDRETYHTWRPFFVGKVRSDGQFEIVKTVAKPIRPVPFPFSRSRAEWETFLETLFKDWNGNWVAPAYRKPSRAAG